MKKSKRLLVIMLALVMMLSLFVPVASAATTSTKITATASNVASSGKIKLSWNAVKNAKNYAVYRATSKSGTYTKLTTTAKLEYTNTSVTAGKTYYYQVKALNSSGKVLCTSSKVSKMCDCARPGIEVSTKSDTGKCFIAWSKVTGAVKYEVYRATSKSGTYSKILTTTKLSCTNTSAKAGSTYYYKVKAIASNTNANSAYSTVVSCTCDCAAPVVTVSNNKETGKNVLKWKTIDGATKYEVYRATSKSGTYSKVATVTALSYTDTSAKAGSTYYYKVKAIAKTSAANSAYSEIKSRTCDCAMITDIVVDYNDNGNIIFTWTKVDGATGYKIYRSNTEKGTYSVISGSKALTEPKFTDTTAKVGSYYYYRLVAVNSKSTAADSSPVEGPALPLYPAAKNLQDESTDKKNIVTWSKVSGVDGYVILRGTSQDLEQMEPLAGVIQPLVSKTCKYTDDGRYHNVYYAIVGVKDMGEDNDPIPSVPVFIYVK